MNSNLQNVILRHYRGDGPKILYDDEYYILIQTIGNRFMNTSDIYHYVSFFCTRVRSYSSNSQLVLCLVCFYFIPKPSGSSLIRSQHKCKKFISFSDVFGRFGGVVEKHVKYFTSKFLPKYFKYLSRIGMAYKDDQTEHIRCLPLLITDQICQYFNESIECKTKKKGVILSSIKTPNEVESGMDLEHIDEKIDISESNGKSSEITLVADNSQPDGTVSAVRANKDEDELVTDHTVANMIVGGLLSVKDSFLKLATKFNELESIQNSNEAIEIEECNSCQGLRKELKTVVHEQKVQARELRNISEKLDLVTFFLYIDKSSSSPNEKPQSFTSTTIAFI